MASDLEEEPRPFWLCFRRRSIRSQKFLNLGCSLACRLFTVVVVVALTSLQQSEEVMAKLVYLH